MRTSDAALHCADTLYIDRTTDSRERARNGALIRGRPTAPRAPERTAGLTKAVKNR